MALRVPEALAALCAAIAASDRLVLLGDLIELRELPLREAFGTATPILRQMVEALGPGGELIYVPGNHDHELLTHDDAMSALTRVLAGAGAEVSVEYPGVWLREDVYAHHGHYLDCHTSTPAFERLAAGAMARFLGLSMATMRGERDYERVLAPIYAWMFAVAQHGDSATDGGEGDRSMRLLRRIREGGALESLALRTGVRTLVAAVSRLGLGPLIGDLSDAQLRRASLTAYGDVLEVLGMRPVHAIFGHTHRAGPLPGEDLSEWVTSSGARLVNTGCWLRERLVMESTPTSPYRAGFAVELDGDGPPRLVNLLDSV